MSMPPYQKKSGSVTHFRRKACIEVEIPLENGCLDLISGASGEIGYRHPFPG